MNQAAILVFRSAQQQLVDCEEWLAEVAPRDRGAWLISGSRATADEVMRRYLDRRGALAGFSRYALIQLAAEIAAPRLAQLGLLPLSQLSESALQQRVVYQIVQKGGLEYFSPVAEMPGFARALSLTLDELQREGVADESLRDLGPGGRDLARILRAYRRELEESRLADRRVILEQAADSLENRQPSLPILLLDCRPQGLSEVRFVAALGAWASHCLATVQFGDELSLQALRQALGGQVRDSSPDSPASSNRLERLRLQLFATEEVGREPVPEDESLEFFSAADEGRECVEIVRHIRDAAAGNIRFDEMAVLLRQPYLYLPLIEDAFRRARIPVHMTRGTRRPHPSGRAFLALLQCAGENLSASRFAEYLALGQVPVPDEVGAPPTQPVEWVAPGTDQLVFKTLIEDQPSPPAEIESLPGDTDSTAPVVAGSLRTPHRWEQLLVDAAVIGGKERWAARLQGLEKEIELQLRGLDPDEEGQAERLRLKLARLLHLSRFALPLIALLDELRQPAKWTEWLDRLQRLAGMALRWPTSVVSVLSELRPMGTIGPVGLAEVQAILMERLKFLLEEPRGNRYGKVFVGGLEEVGGMSFRRVFVPGLAEGIFPQKAKEDPLLLDEARKRIDLPSSLERKNHQERLLLRTAVSVCQERLTISYPRVELAQGRPRVPSFYFLDVLRAAEGRLPDVRELERRAAAASSSRLGWPAPPRPEMALDDPEYDLAILEVALERKESRQGRARFLLQVNDCLARSLRTRWWRWSSRRFSPADGLVSPNTETRRLIQQESLYRRSFSPTALQRFAACPYRFFLYAIQRLEPREEPVAIEQMDPLTRGALFHEVQFRLFRSLRETNQLPITPSNRVEIESQAEKILEEVAEHFFQELAPAIPSIWESEVKALGADLRGWIRRVAESPEGWVPYRFEFAFGLPLDEDRDPHSKPDPVKVFDGVLLRGSIDLLEREARGDRQRVTDHKTGKAPKEAHLVVSGGEILQPILYGAAAEQLTGKGVSEGRLFYCTQRGDFEVRSVPLEDHNQEKARRVLGVIEDWIQNGFLPAAPRKDACSFCDYRTVCGPYEELRVGRKYPDDLEDLTEIRALP